MIELYDYETHEQTRTFDTYNDVDCFNYSDVHDYIKFVKHGYGKVTDHASREIRLRRMTREQGIELVKKYSTQKPKNLALFLNWLGITENSFLYLIDQHRNKDIWKRNDNWEWYRTTDDVTITENDHSASLSIIDNFTDFQITQPKASSDKTGEYILIGKGV